MILLGIMLVGLCGTICIAEAIYMLVVRNLCTQKVMAQYVTCKTRYNIGTPLPETYIPCFTYCWEGKEYNAMSLGGGLFKKNIMKFHSDQQYEVYIDPKKPTRLCLNRKISRAEITGWIVGVGCYFLVVVMMFLLFVEMIES